MLYSMNLKKRKKTLFAFIIVIICVLMFSILWIVVLYLGGPQTPVENTDTIVDQPSEDLVIFKDAAVEEVVPVEELVEAASGTEENTGALLDSSTTTWE